MSVLGSIEVAIKANLDPLSKGLKKARQRVNDFSKMAGRGFAAVARGVFSLKGAIAGLGVGLLAKGFIDTGSAMDNMKMSLDTITKGDGEEWFNKLNTWALKMPVNTAKAIESFTMMRAMGLKPTIDQMTVLVDTMSALGGNGDTLEGISRALGQMKTKGKISAEELMQLAERGIPAMEILKQKFGDVETSTLNADEAIQALFEGMGERFGGQSEKMQTMWSGMMESLKSYWVEFKRLVMESGVMDWLEGKLKTIIDQIDIWAQNGQLGEWAYEMGSTLVEWFEKAQTAITNAATWSIEHWSQLKIHVDAVWTATKWTADKIWFVFDKLGKFIGTTVAYAVTAIERLKYIWDTGDLSMILKPMITMSPPQPWKSGIAEMQDDIGGLSGHDVTMDFSQPKQELLGLQKIVAESGFGSVTGELRVGAASTARWTNPLGTFETGTRYVPKTGPYTLHEGESVKTKKEANQERRNQSGNMIFNFPNYLGEKDSLIRTIRSGMNNLALRGA